MAPRGHTQWVRNLRVSGEGRLVSAAAARVHGDELADEEKPALLRAYLKKWKWEVGAFFDGVDADAPEPSYSESPPNTRSSGSQLDPRAGYSLITVLTKVPFDSAFASSSKTPAGTSS